MLGDDRVAPVPMARVISHELTLLGVHGMAVPPLRPLLDAVAAGRLDPGRLVGATVALDAAGAELAAIGALHAPRHHRHHVVLACKKGDRPLLARCIG